MANRVICAILIIAAASFGAKTTYIRTGAVFDGRQLLGKKIIIVENGMIKDVAGWDYGIPPDGDIIDADNQTVLPGLIDSRIRFTAPPVPFMNEIEKHGSGKLTAQEMSAFPQNRLELLMNGVTTILDIGTPLAVCSGIRKSMAKGTVLGPDLYFAGPEITAPDGHPVRTVYPGKHDLIDNGTFQVADTGRARKKVAALAEQQVVCIAIVYDRVGWFRKGGAPRLALEVTRAIIDEAHTRGLKVIAAVGSEKEAEEMVGAGIDGIDGGFGTSRDSLLVEMAKRGIFFTPMMRAAEQGRPAAGTDIASALKRAWSLKVPVCTGSGFPASSGPRCGDDLWQEMELWEEAGIPRLEVLKSATWEAAARLGKLEEVGRIAPGCRANMVFLDGSIHEGVLASYRISRVMVHGVTVIENGKLSPSFARRFREKSVQFLGYPYWDPLLSYLVGGSVSDCDLFHSGINAEAGVLFSFRNMWWADVSFGPPSPIPRTALSADFHFDNQNRLYYGLGNDSKLADATEFANVIFKERVSGTTRITKQVKVLTACTFDQSRLSAYNGTSLPAVTGSRGGNESIVSTFLIRDSRDHENNPWSGFYLAIGGQVAPPIFAGSHGFEKFIFDARGYVSVAHRHILAGRVLYEQAFGTVPFYYLPEFGGDTLGRGYLPYRFRDRVGLYGQFEYRFPVFSFLSGVVFVDVGQFKNRPADLLLTGFHPSVGVGPRLIFDRNENSIIGIDVGVTPEGWNLVLHTGHAF